MPGSGHALVVEREDEFVLLAERFLGRVHRAGGRRRERRPARRRRLFARAGSSTAGTAYHWELHGTGGRETVCLFNGLAMSTKSWLSFLPELTGERDVLLYDYLGQGASDDAELAGRADLRLRRRARGRPRRARDRAGSTRSASRTAGSSRPSSRAATRRASRTLTLSGILLTQETLFSMYQDVSLRFYAGGPAALRPLHAVPLREDLRRGVRRARRARSSSRCGRASTTGTRAASRRSCGSRRRRTRSSRRSGENAASYRRDPVPGPRPRGRRGPRDPAVPAAEDPVRDPARRRTRRSRAPGTSSTSRSPRSSGRGCGGFLGPRGASGGRGARRARAGGGRTRARLLQHPVPEDLGDLAHDEVAVLAELLRDAEEDLDRVVLEEDAAREHDGGRRRGRRGGSRRRRASPCVTMKRSKREAISE